MILWIARQTKGRRDIGRWKLYRQYRQAGFLCEIQGQPERGFRTHFDALSWLRKTQSILASPKDGFFLREDGSVEYRDIQFRKGLFFLGKLGYWPWQAS